MGKIIKRLLIAVLIAALVCGGIYGGLTFYRNSQKRAVLVYPVSEVITPAEFFFDESQSYGAISAERMQSVYISSTQNVKEVLVEEGQTIKRGDPLLTYDTTLSSIQLEKAEIELAQQELSLKRLEDDLVKINRLVPSAEDEGDYGYGDGEPEEEEPEPTEEPVITYTPQPTGVRFDGSGTMQDPYVYLWSLSDALTPRRLLAMFTESGTLEEEEVFADEGEEITEEDGSVETAKEAVLWQRLGLLPYPVWGDVEEGIEDDALFAEPWVEDGVEEGIEVTDPYEEDLLQGEDGYESPALDEGFEASPDDEYVYEEIPADPDYGFVESGEELLDPEDPSLDPEYEEPEEPGIGYEIPVELPGDEEVVDPEAAYTWLKGAPNEIYVILEIHESDHVYAPLLQRYGLHLIRDGQQVAVRLFNPDAVQTEEGESTEPVDGEEAPNDEVEDGLHPELSTGGYEGADIDWGDDDGENEEEAPSLSESAIDFTAHYTAKEIEELKLSQEKEIRDATLEYKMAAVNLRQMQAELADGAVKSRIDGVIKTVRDPDEAYTSGSAVVVVSGGGGYSVTISISELELTSVAVDQEVTISSFSNEEDMYDGYIESIGDYPTSDGDNWGMGNPFVSYYPCKVNITDEAAEFREGDYVSVRYSPLEDNGRNAFYLENMFIRSDSTGRYVYVENADGKLERRNIVTGKVMDGYATEVRGGISVNDYIAFPYGTNLAEGADTEEASIDALYS